MPATSDLADPAECEAVLDTPAVDMFDGSRYTCRQRMSWFQNSVGLSELEAKEKIALNHPNECTACWPYVKYKAAGEAGVSQKRGIAIQRSFVSQVGIVSLRSAVSWGYGWDPVVLPDQQVLWEPMLWGESDLLRLEDISRDDIDWGPLDVNRVLLAFNEPNFPEQANLSPERAAELWPRLEALAASRGISKLVSPAVNFHHMYDGIDWLARFFEVCVGCKVDAIAFHSYTCYARFLRDHIDLYRVFGKPLWLTEFACAEGGAINDGRRSAEGQMAYLREAIPMLERDPDVEAYAWFSYFSDQWAFPVDGHTGDAGLLHADGSLSELGRLYGSFK